MMESEPPPLPPVLPPATAPGFTQGLLLEGRLHPLTLLFSAWHTIRGMIIPLILLVFFGRRRAEDTYLFIAMVFLILPISLATIRYFTFTYKIQNGELITHHGVLGRTQRIIPLSRVQDIRIEQSVLHRLFRMAEVHVETAGGKEPEASLSVLALVEAERLRAAIFDVKGVAKAETASAEREVIRRLTVRELLMAGLTSNQVASAVAVLVVLWRLMDEFVRPELYQRWIERSAEAATVWLTQVGAGAWLVFLVFIVAATALGMIFSVIGSVVMFYGFTLARSGEDLHRSYGLFTRRLSSLPRRRIQVLKIEETILRRVFKLATLRADTAAAAGSHHQQEKGGRDMLLPIVPRSAVDGLLPTFFPDLDEAGDWRKVARLAIRRGTIKASVVLSLLAAISYLVQRSWPSLWPLLLAPVAYWVNAMSYRYLGYVHGPRYFRTRHGWLRRSTHIVPIRNAQVVVVRQTPLDRRLKVASVLVDTAGKANTGGPPHIHNVVYDEAVELARGLARQAAETRFKL